MTPRPDGHLHVVFGAEEALSADPYETLVPEGEYEVGFVKSERYRWFERRMLRVTFQIVSPGNHMGRLLYGWFTLPEGRVTPSHALHRLYVAATGRKPPKDLVRRDPRTYLADSHFQARVRTVRRDMDHVERPEGASYSKVDRLLRRLEGTPPCLQEPQRSSSSSLSLSQSESQSQSQSGSHRRRRAKTKTSGTGAPALGAKRARTNECAQAQVGEAARDKPAAASSHSSNPQAAQESTLPSEQLEPWLLETLSKAPIVDHPALERQYRRDFGAEADLGCLRVALAGQGHRIKQTTRTGPKGLIVRYWLREEPNAG